ncbi:AraC family transcriptional regulator [Flavivirga sp. 57AJ16]|uniref:helix-turn-helix domain-containing protein n=1 Tax=Flavivirga sp. 57AJ16 TaxID=3025307 RepID=UPI0023650BB2|nr:helix-turn-helix transcriptional regulator [Flavivirga sp. 57AJ16]MDD7886014.1 helix-turn-helix transcriptional regulator [Flavivirga sp. 57AJ16]
MKKTLEIEDFYVENLKWVPENLKSSIGHFNVFRLEEFSGLDPKPMPYSRKDYYKISLIVGKSKVHYADKTIEINNQGLLFANPQIPYNWEQVDSQLSGYFCVFTEAFFNQYGDLNKYPVFQPSGNQIFNLTTENSAKFAAIFEQMFTEINSDYTFKYDILRNLVFELIHSGIKLDPVTYRVDYQSNASERISSMFIELLERQFPIENTSQKIKLRTAKDYANQLNVHVNHLNRALKEVTGKSTSSLITRRLTKEAKILLAHTHWNVSEIAYALGFEETSHFSNFFKKHIQQSPIQFRKNKIV